MAKRRGGFRRYQRGPIDHTQQLGTLAGKTAIVTTLDDQVEVNTFCTSVKCVYTVNEMTGGVDKGPLLCGWAHSNYDLAEIEEWIENQTLGWSVNDLVQQEVAKRKVRLVG